MNTDEYYTEKDIMFLLVTKSKNAAIRKHCKSIKISNRFLYERKSIV